ncbi:SGNH/GDSL hydrolase family protein [Denitromonas iodatirespirans]|uniref:SGNH/GDSL hydrolase family protein n=1 Tax=Denitromonas iodatirespirans TaxID=2795389 RepID=A0A944H8E7_DENI1|nr:SGNH/GDSL hydrolase family protein [Denitromonas iodatirespirans]MBT0962228.1 SGNH/GDSL hydrolase family protein [Denitromonas iodatirespirans]
MCSRFPVRSGLISIALILCTGLAGNAVVAAPTAIKDGGSILGKLTTKGDKKTYVFSGAAGSTAHVSLSTMASADGFSPSYVVLDPNGKVAKRAWGSPVASESFKLTKSGTHRIVVQDNSWFSTGVGAFSLHLATSAEATEHGALDPYTPSDQSITPGDLDAYILSATAGDTIHLSIGRTNATDTLQPAFYVYGPNGEQVAWDGGTDAAWASFLARKTGTYRVIVKDFSWAADATGAYRIHMARSTASKEASRLINHGSVSGHITPADLDSFVFHAQSGDVVTLRADLLASEDDTAEPTFHVYGPDAKEVDWATGTTSATKTFRAPADGLYAVVVRDGSVGAAGTGDYTLALSVNADRFSYAALGDSYSSGEGVLPYHDLSDDDWRGCHRSYAAYAASVQLPGDSQKLLDRLDADVDLIACTGATTENVTASGYGQYGQPPQLDPANGVDERRDLVTVSIGGNDADFIPIFAVCMLEASCQSYQPFAPDSSMTLKEWITQKLEEAETKINQTHAEIRRLTPNAATLVLGYPVLLSGRECAALTFPPGEDTDIKLDAAEQEFLMETNRKLNDIIARSAKRNGLHYVPVEKQFAGHEICGSNTPWVNGIDLDNPKSSLHPNRLGQQAYARAINDYLLAAGTAWPYGYLANGLPRNPTPMTSQQPSSTGR